MARPVDLLDLFGRNPERDAPIERDGINLDVESFAIGVLPCTSDLGPYGLARFRIANLVSEMGWCLGRHILC